MLSNNMKRMFNGRVLAVGFAAVLAAALVIGFMPSTSQDAESAGGLQSNKHNSQGLTVTLHFQKGSGKSLELIGCTALEASNATTKQCGASKTVTRNHTVQAAIEWNGQPNGSGCASVGGVEFCW